MDKKNKKEKEEEAGTIGQEQPSGTTVENLAAERHEVEEKQSTKSKKSKRKRGEASGDNQAVPGEGKKEHPVALEETGQKQQSLDTAVQNLATRFDEAEGERSGKSKKSKSKRSDAGETQKLQTLDATVGNSVAKSDEAEGKQSSKSKKTKSKPDDAGDGEHKTLDGSVENPVANSDEVEGKQSSESKKTKSKPNDAGEGQQKTLDGSVENSVANSDEVEGKQSSKSKKTKSKRGEASAGDQDLTRKDKKRKKEHPVMLEKISQPKNTSEGENGEIKERGKESSKSSLKSSEDTSAGGEEADVDGKNDKKKNKSKEGKLLEGIKEKEKAARPKSKGKRVSFADSTEVFETEGSDGEGTEGGKKRKAAQSKNKGKRVSFADSTEVFENEGGGGEGTEGGKKKGKKAAQSMNKGKRVSFADSAEVFETECGDDEEGGTSDEPKFLHGVRFTQEEDDTLMEAIQDFIEMKQLGEKGLEMIRTSRKHKELLHCWDVIGKSLPHRPHSAIYKRARILLSRSEVRGWTDDEKDYIRSFVKKNGTDWKQLAHELRKSDIHVKDTWRRIKSDNLQKGYWTQDEHQKLFDLVNLDLRMRAHQIKNPDNRKLRDNISWEAISEKLSTRNHKNCCLKWYDTLASPLVRKGVWADLDDYLLVEALQKDDAICIEDVDWDSLLDHRSGQVCRQRWNQMVRGLGGHREKPFIEQVDVLSKRYCPEMIEYRKDSEETPAGDANGDKKKKKSKESEEPGVASAEVKKEKKKKKKQSKESEKPGVASAEVEKEKKKKKKSKDSEEPGAANAEVEKEKKKKRKKSKDSEEPVAANAEVEKEKKKKRKKSKESEEPGAANAEVEKEKKKKKRKSKESEEPGGANAEVEKENKKKKKTDTQDDEVAPMEAESGKKAKKKKIKQADH